MSRPTANPASKSHHNHQTSTLMHPASQVTQVTSPPGTISHFFGYMFHTISLFHQELHTDDDHKDFDASNSDNSPTLSLSLLSTLMPRLQLSIHPPLHWLDLLPLFRPSHPAQQLLFTLLSLFLSKTRLLWLLPPLLLISSLMALLTK